MIEFKTIASAEVVDVIAAAIHAFGEDNLSRCKRQACMIADQLVVHGYLPTAQEDAEIRAEIEAESASVN